ncbi:glycosyltransferase family 2 protein [Spirosoma utsteinense]|uniref:Glycosyltransferase involved in cell wall biosynthesis n=1 Tax=Spirosoma utsteinense TaxID=2585773 RepID=A0ABR6W0A1_9BACT|nr:glycosyltransferase family 2 protein [Spirosoma utsteinense]MBC3783820.1 glycosyltransferase involved in cell wall biosynthesis [Spirosoma utsteinense]MBC3790036.1 glycosyltransferase involved in cell wall biosynthesis [Spirosoma utsteinense]
MKRPLISIITVVYNASSTFEATINSVLSQKKELFEYWIIDGASTDGSVDIIRKYENQLAGWISEPDKGIYDAMNKGIDYVTGDWLFFLGADDLLCEGILEKISEYLKPDLKVVYGNVLFDTGHIMRSRIGLRCLFENRLHHQSAFYHRDLFNEFRYNQKFRICADYELTLRIYLQKQPALYVPYSIAVFASGGISNELTSDDINTIRGLYLKSPALNSLYSFMINAYYSYFKAKVSLKGRLKKVLSSNV